MLDSAAAAGEGGRVVAPSMEGVHDDLVLVRAVCGSGVRTM